MNKCEKLTPEILASMPVIALTGNKEITVDGFKGIEEYSELSVSFKAGSLLMTVIGCDLSIRYMSLHTIVIAGEIKSVEFGGKC